MHIRGQVRAAISAALTDIMTSGSVYTERANRLGADDLPALLIYMADETAENDQRGMGPYVVETSQSVTLELHAAGDDGAAVHTAIDAMDSESEALLAADAPLAALLELLERQSSTVEMNTDQDRVYGLRTVTYVATWRHVFGAPETPEG